MAAPLRDTAEVLTGAYGTDQDEQYRVLLVLQTWAGTAGIDLHIADPQPLALQRTGIELGL